MGVRWPQEVDLKDGENWELKARLLVEAEYEFGYLAPVPKLDENLCETWSVECVL